MSYPGLFGSTNTGTNSGDPNTRNMSQRELQDLQDQIRSQQPSQQSQQPQEPYTPTIEDSYRHYGSVPNMSQESSKETHGMTDAEVKAYYGLSNHTDAVTTPAYAPAPRNMTPVYALAPASAPTPASAPPRLYEMAKTYVRKGKDGFRDDIYFYKDDDKKNPPTKGTVWDTNFFGKTYDIAVGSNRFKVDKVYTPNFDKSHSGGRRQKSKKMYKKRNLRKNSKSKSKRRHSRSRRH